MAVQGEVGAANQNGKQGRQIPIVCPGHTRPLAELQFCHVEEEDRTFLLSACHGAFSVLNFALVVCFVFSPFL
jgi:hypothetical protein